MRIKVDRRSAAYRRLISAGFRIKNINLVKTSHWYIPTIRFQCVCGRTEMIAGYVFERREIPKKMDIAKIIEDLGGVSEDHLRADGYSNEEIDRIRRAYNEKEQTK